MDTGRVIHKRYLLQRLIQRGAACVVYQALDQMLQRAVLVKAAPVEHMGTYRAALRATAQFAHPNIVGLYDLIAEPTVLYIVQEYVDGGGFATLLRTPLAPSQIADIGAQICQALLYAGTPSRKMCHGDLTPSAVLRDRHGIMRINNFGLPSDASYFHAWNMVGGGNGPALADPHLPWGQLSDGRKADDTRAVGLLLYQLLASRNTDAISVEPPADGRLHFMRNASAELCEIVVRAVVRMHPQNIHTPDLLYRELKNLAEMLEAASPINSSSELAYAGEAVPKGKSLSVPGGQLAPTSFASTLPTTEEGFVSRMAAAETMAPSAPTVANVPMQLAAARQAAYANSANTQKQQGHVNTPLLLLACIVFFALFFGFGYLLAHAIFP